MLTPFNGIASKK